MMFRFLFLAIALTRAEERVFFHHIPKTAGTSLFTDIEHKMSMPVLTAECCLKNALPATHVISMVREPLPHVYSQFLECKYDQWGKDMTRGTGFPREGTDADGFKRWMIHFQTSDDFFNCYHPANMQTRSFDPRCKDSHGPLALTPVSAAIAVKRMTEIAFVGLQEYYELSLCMIHATVRKKIPPECVCSESKTSRVNATKIRHGVPRHSAKDLSDNTLEMVKNFTRVDSALYSAAKQLFWERVKAAECALGQTLKCHYSH